MEGGGTVFMTASREAPNYRGPGHNGFLHDANGRDYLVYHAYDRDNEGKSALRIAPLHWGEAGWPSIGR